MNEIRPRAISRGGWSSAFSMDELARVFVVHVDSPRVDEEHEYLDVWYLLWLESFLVFSKGLVLFCFSYVLFLENEPSI